MTARTPSTVLTGPPAGATGRDHRPDKPANVFVSLTRLAPFHASALRLMNISVESDSAFADFEEAFKGDPALTADLLLVANSAEFGLRSRIETIRHALAFLGLERVRSLGVTIAFSFYVRNVPRTKYMAGVWQHSLAAAAIAELMGGLCGQRSAYTAALTHDLGRLALFLALGADYAAYMEQPFRDEQEASAAELARFGMDHCEAGARAAIQWGFPESLQSVMLEHHGKISGNPRDQLNLVRAACGIASALGFPEVKAPAPLYDEVLPEPLRYPGLEPEALRERVQRLLATFQPGA